MHNDHKVFECGISCSRKVRVTFVGEEPGRELASLCAPLYYSRGRDGTNEPGCYYMWDFRAAAGYNFAALSPSEIVRMELTEDSFRIEEIRVSRRGIGNVREDGDAGT